MSSVLSLLHFPKHIRARVPLAARAQCLRRAGKYPRDVNVSLRLAAVLAGLGEMGWSKVLLTPQFGPRQRLGLILTDAELEPDPVRIGRIRDRCKICVRDCPGNAIDPKKGNTITSPGAGRSRTTFSAGAAATTAPHSRRLAM